MDESTRAPERFHINHDLDEDLSHAQQLSHHEDVAILTSTPPCPLCLCSPDTHSFYCETCIRNGRIRHTTAVSLYDDDYAKKLSDLVTLQDKLQALNAVCEKRLQKAVQWQMIRQQIAKKRLRVDCLRAIVAEKRQQVAKKKLESSDLLQKNRELKRTIPRYHGKVQEMEDYVLNKKTHLARKLTERTACERNVQAAVKEFVRKLMKFIFPIECRVGGGVECHTQQLQQQQQALGPSTARELAEATRTAFVEGHWILQDSGGGARSGASSPVAPPAQQPTSAAALQQHVYVIVAAALPANGDYKAYSEWFVKNRETLPNPTLDKDERINENPAYGLLAALTYTAHLIQILGFYLDVRFPFKVTAADFCTGFLSDRTFQKRVTRLNANVVQLLYTHGVRLVGVRPEETLKNLTLLLDVIQQGEGRPHRYVDPSNVNFNLIDEHFSPVLLTDSCTDTDEEDENSLQTEWEALDVVSPMPSLEGTHGNQLVATANPLQTASMTMTNAAASIASIFRGLTGR